MWLKAARPLNHDFSSATAMKSNLGWDTLRAFLIMESSSFSSLNISHYVFAIQGDTWIKGCQIFVLDVSPQLVAKSIHPAFTVAVRQLLRLSLKLLLEVVNLILSSLGSSRKERKKGLRTIQMMYGVAVTNFPAHMRLD